jgi:hypothetical protein
MKKKEIPQQAEINFFSEDQMRKLSQVATVMEATEGFIPSFYVFNNKLYSRLHKKDGEEVTGYAGMSVDKTVELVYYSYVTQMRKEYGLEDDKSFELWLKLR